jgi:hypothetical protein
VGIRQVLIAAVVVATATFSVSASAASLAGLGLQINIDGQSAGYVGPTTLGCVEVAGTPTANCIGSNATVGTLQLNSWNVFVDSDPVINGIVAVTNLGAVTQQFTLIFTLPIAPAIPGGTVIGGSIQGGATDNTGNGVTLSTPTGSAFYTARIDNADVQSMYLDPQVFSTLASYGSVNVPALSFGAPIPSQPGPAALTNIGIRLDFVLTPGDSASFTSNFVVQPAPAVIPVPAAVWLFGSALGLLGWIRRR